MWDILFRMPTTTDLIMRFGGFEEMGALLGLSESTVRNWPERGIPSRLHLRLLRLASERGVQLSGDELLSTASRTGRAA